MVLANDNSFALSTQGMADDLANKAIPPLPHRKQPIFANRA